MHSTPRVQKVGSAELAERNLLEHLHPGQTPENLHAFASHFGRTFDL